jgi:hypothetical protein
VFQATHFVDKHTSESTSPYFAYFEFEFNSKRGVLGELGGFLLCLLFVAFWFLCCCCCFCYFQFLWRRRRRRRLQKRGREVEGECPKVDCVYDQVAVEDAVVSPVLLVCGHAVFDSELKTSINWEHKFEAKFIVHLFLGLEGLL